MANEDFTALDGPLAPLANPDEAELAARQAIEAEPGDWQGYAALANALVARKQAWRVEQALPVARRAVALAPDESDARLALADALSAVRPRRIRTWVAARAEIDQAELLGADAEELTEHRSQAQRPGYLPAVFWACFLLCMPFGNDGDATTKTIAWTALFVLLIALYVVRIRPPGRSVRESLDIQRKLTRLRLPTHEHIARRAPIGAALLTILLFPAASMSIPGADGGPPLRWTVWLVLGGLLPAGLAVWIGTDWWLGSGTVLRVLRHDAYVAGSVTITVILAAASPALVLRGLQSEGLWLLLFLTQMAWLIGSAVSAAKLTSRRKKAALPYSP